MRRTYHGDTVIGIAILDGKQHRAELAKREALAKKKKPREPRMTLASFKGLLARASPRTVLGNITTWWQNQKKYVHCEIAFRLPEIPGKEDTRCLAFGVFAEEGVVQTLREFNNRAYDWIWLSVTQEEVQKMFSFCSAQTGKSMSWSGARLSPLWPIVPPLDSEGVPSEWWCSALVVAALQQIGLFRYHRAQALEADEIAAFLRNHPRSMISFSPLDRVGLHRSTLGMF